MEELMDAAQTFTDRPTLELVRAVEAGDADLVARLIAGGADPNAVGAKGVTPLAWSVMHGCLEGFEALLAGGADPAVAMDGGTTIVHLAAMATDPGFLHTVLAFGVDPDIENSRTGQSPIMTAMYADCDPQVLRLLEVGADPDHADHDGNRPLHIAGLTKKPQFVLALLHAGADPTVRNDAGFDFKTYLDIRPSDLSDGAQRRFDAVDAWLDEHGVDLRAETSA